MNTGFIHNFSEEDNAECQQDNQDSILCGTHGLLILLYRNLEIDAETGIIYKARCVPIGFQVDAGCFTQWDEVNGLRAFQFDFYFVRQFLIVLQFR